MYSMLFQLMRELGRQFGYAPDGDFQCTEALAKAVHNHQLAHLKHSPLFFGIEFEISIISTSLNLRCLKI
jgi:hypothetical protein